jgi:CRP-like cAMP-binding protein
MERQLVTRRMLTRELALNAATRPLNVVVPVAVAAAAVLLETVWLLPLAFVVYIAMTVATFFDADEAERVGKATYDRARPEQRAVAPPQATRFEPAIANRLESARAVELRIRQAAETAPVPRVDLTTEVGRVLAGLEKLGERAQQIHDYLAEQDVATLRSRLRAVEGRSSGDGAVDGTNKELAAALAEQLAAIVQLEQELRRLDAQMEQATASLAAILGHLVRMNATEEATSQRDVVAEARNLRRSVSLSADAARDAHDELSGRR